MALSNFGVSKTQSSTEMKTPLHHPQHLWICCVYMGGRISNVFNNAIGVKQGSPLSPTLFGLYIDAWEQMVVKKYLFDNLVTLVLLYGVEVWGGSILKSTWKDFENVQTNFLVKLQVMIKFLLVKIHVAFKIMCIKRLEPHHHCFNTN